MQPPFQNNYAHLHDPKSKQKNGNIWRTVKITLTVNILLINQLTRNHSPEITTTILATFYILVTLTLHFDLDQQRWPRQCEKACQI